jgi:NAD(P)-dependent dehydrogenase (short-subunit alcohol dehydrogenase family)
MEAARFAGRTALVTGAAHGIGRATALRLAREGAAVVAADVDAAGLAEVAAAIASAGGDCVPVTADVLDEAAVSRLVETAVGRCGGVDVLVNAVGGSTVIERPDAPIDELSLDDWERVLAFNLRGTFLCTRAVVPHMKAAGRGAIVNLSSIVARGDGHAARTSAPYVLAKAGIEALTRRLAHELGPFGIRCNAASPAVTLTERIERRIDARGPGERARMAGAVPLRRLATPEDLAGVIAFLASDDAAFVSGETIGATGGQ